MADTQSMLDARVLEFQDSYMQICKNIPVEDLGKLFEANDAIGISALLSRYNSAALASLPKDAVRLPSREQFNFSKDASGALLPVTIKIVTKGAEVKFSAVHTLTSKSSLQTIQNFFEDAYVALLEVSSQQGNIDALNRLLAELSEGVDFTPRFAIGNRVIQEISDGEVVFSINPERVYDLDRLILFQEPSEILSEETIERKYQEEIEAIEAAGTTVGLVESPSDLIKYFMLPHRRKTVALLREANTMKLERAKKISTPRSFGYETEDLYAVINHDDGTYSVVLSPINKETLERVDVDIISEL